MGDKFDTYEKQNMGQCAEKKYTQNVQVHDIMGCCLSS